MSTSQSWGGSLIFKVAGARADPNCRRFDAKHLDHCDATEAARAFIAAYPFRQIISDDGALTRGRRLLVQIERGQLSGRVRGDSFTVTLRGGVRLVAGREHA